MFEIYVNNIKVKTYPFKIQAIIYCFLNGYITTSTGDFKDKQWYFLNPKVKINSVKKWQNKIYNNAK